MNNLVEFQLLQNFCLFRMLGPWYCPFVKGIKFWKSADVAIRLKSFNIARPYEETKLSAIRF